MNKLLAVLQFFTALILTIASIATIINLLFISTRPETISVVNTMIGQGILIICLLVISRILLKKGLLGWRGTDSRTGSNSSTD